jgi:hypothetical protein
MTTKIEAPGMSTVTSMTQMREIVKVENNVIEIKDSFDIQITSLGVSQRISALVKRKITTRGTNLLTEIENVEPPEFRTQIEEMLKRARILAPEYPESPMSIGRKWSIQVNYSVEIAGIPVTLQGEATYSIKAKENIIVQAGNFVCLNVQCDVKLEGEIGVGENKIYVLLTGNGRMWLMTQKYVQVKGLLDMTMVLKIADTETSIPIQTQIELIEYSRSTGTEI